MNPTQSDRRVHARLLDGTEVVRYERAGKWYREHPDGRRRAITFPVAVAYGRVANQAGGEVYHGVPGGSRFDAVVQRLG